MCALQTVSRDAFVLLCLFSFLCKIASEIVWGEVGNY